MKSLVLFFTFLLAHFTWGAEAAVNPCGESREIWFKCKADADCAISVDACKAPSAVNKSYANEFEGYSNCLAPMVDCAPYSGPPKSKLSSVCKEGKCHLK